MLFTSLGDLVVDVVGWFSVGLLWVICVFAGLLLIAWSNVFLRLAWYGASEAFGWVG